MNNRNLYAGLIVLATLLLGVSCKEEKLEIKPVRTMGIDMTLDPGPVEANIPAPYVVEVGEEFELYISNNEEGVYYRWTVPDALALISGQGTNRIRLAINDEGASVSAGSIGVRAERDGVLSAMRWFSGSVATPVSPDVPEFVITGYSTDPASTDSPYEFIQLCATQGIDFSLTPFTVVTCNNAGASMPGATANWFPEEDGTHPNGANPPVTMFFNKFQGWATGGIRTYKFELTSGTVSKGEFFYIGGNGKRVNGGGATSASMADAKWIESASVPYHQVESPEFYPGGPKGSPTTNLLANSGNAFGIAAFRGLEVRETTVPIDVVWTGTARAYQASPERGFRIGNTDHYSVMHPDTDALQPFYYMGSNTARFVYSAATNTGWFPMMGGVFNPSTNTWEEKRKTGTAAADMPFVTPPAGVGYTFFETEQEVTGSNPTRIAKPTVIR